MTVYVVLSSIDYEGDQLCSVFASRESAEQETDQRNRDDAKRWGGNRFVSYRVEERELLP